MPGGCGFGSSGDGLGLSVSGFSVFVWEGLGFRASGP